MDIRRRTQILSRMLALLIASIASSMGVAQEQETGTPPERVPSSQISIEHVEQAIVELEQSTETAAEVKLQATENYQAALKNLQTAADHDARFKALIADAEAVAARTQQLKTQTVELKDKKPSIESGLSIQALEQLLPATELQFSSFKKARQDAESELQSRSPRRKEIRARLMAIQEKVADVTSQLTNLASSEQTIQCQSLITRLVTRKLSLEKEKPALEAELARFDAEEAADLVRLRIEVATSNAVFTEKLIALIQQKINAVREAAAEESVQAARREAINADPALKVHAERNQALAESAKQVAEALAETESKRKASTAIYDGLVRQFAQTKKKVDSVGLSSSVGALLRKQKMTLPNVASRRAAVAGRQKLINDTQYQLFEHEEAHQELAFIDATIEKVLADATKEKSTNRILLETAARDLITRKREYLTDLVRSTGQYFDTLIELDTVDRQVISLEAEYENYIDERVLWIRSGSPLTSGVKIEATDAWMLSPEKWKEASVILAGDARNYAWLYMLCLSILGILIGRGRKLQKAITAAGESAEKSSCLSIEPTLLGLWLTAISVMGWPLVCVFIGWRLGQSAGESEFTAAVGQGIKVVGLLWGSVDFVRQLCRRKGLGESHFGWPIHATTAFHRDIKFCALIALPIFFVASTLASSDGIQERSEIQRIAFILGMCVITFGVFRMLRPSGIFRDYFAANQSRLIAKLKLLLPLSGVALCGSLVALAATGYFFTAQTLVWRLLATCLFLTTLVVARSVFYRMLFLRRRHLSMQQARERAAAAKLAGEGVVNSQLIAGIETQNAHADITAQNLQSRNLISAAMSAVAIVGLWMIWIQVLPALSMIGNHPVWGDSEAVAVAGAANPTTSPMAASNGSSGESMSPQILSNDENISNSITVSDIALAILVVVITIILCRNFPGLLEMSVLQQLPLEASVRYAITTLVSYLIVIVGTIIACSTIGLQWSQIQWLVTALTFGLAFGLQEIFANFVAGLIILLERPVRVGDVVTVDDVTGVVSRIRIRATSITNWDRKEYVVPNKEFITGKLLNWTLSDKVNRIMVNVGLAYGSDTEQARELLLKAANDHPVVLKDPAAIAVFEGFGDNSLNLVLRAFLPSLENRLQIIHELHTTIDQTFRQAKIEIAFPQRDLHIRSIAGASALGLEVNDNEASSRDELRDAA